MINERKNNSLAYKLLDEVEFKTSKSSGPGGQNVNKVNTRVELRFDINKSSALSAEEKIQVFQSLSNRISKEGILSVASQSKRTQLQNKEETIARFLELIKAVFTPEKERIPTRPGKSAVAKRLDEKRKKSNIKELRKPPEID